MSLSEIVCYFSVVLFCIGARSGPRTHFVLFVTFSVGVMFSSVVIK